MKVLVLLAKGFEMMEFAPFIDIIGWGRNDYGYPIEVVTCGFHKQVTSTFGITISVDQTIEEIEVSDYKALVIPGGFEEFGFYEEAYDERFLELIRKFDKENKLIATVCVGALPVAKSGVLKNKRATTYHLDGGKRQGQLKALGAEVVNEPVVVDSDIITSYCPETAATVAFLLLERLTSYEKMQVVRKHMGFKEIEVGRAKG